MFLERVTYAFAFVIVLVYLFALASEAVWVENEKG